MTLSDAEAAVLRRLLGDVEQDISAMFGPAPPEGALAPPPLLASWARLVGTLALGPAPEVRPCPNCQRECRRAASLCGNCWTRLPPVSARDGA